MPLSLPLALALHALVAFRIDVRGLVQDSAGTPLRDVVAELVEGASVLPRMDTLTDAAGLFAFDSGVVTGVHARAPRVSEGLVVALDRAAAVRIDLLDLRGARVATRTLQAGKGAWKVAGLEGLAPRGRGVHVAVASTEGHILSSLLVASAGGRAEPLRLVPAVAPASARAADAGSFVVDLRKEGFLPRTVALSSSIQDLGVVVLQRDPLERRLDSLVALMTLDDKLGQMTQGLIGTGTRDIVSLKLGSLLSGGGDPLPNYDSIQNAALTTARRIPILYGIDAVHGQAKAAGATVFPHHIGLGATRDSALVRRIGEATAQEMLATGTDWAFAPCIAVPQDERWGRTYEGFGETPELAASLGAAEVRGLQGVAAPWSVVACAKHFVADGGTTWNTGTQGTTLDQGDARITDAELRRVHLPGYRAAVRAGVGTVMASYSLVDGVRNHANRALLTGVLKTELGFDGFVVSDWLAIAQIDTTDYAKSVAASVNAGVDMAMEPGTHAKFITTLKSLVTAGTVPQTRIDDAVRRILRVKYRSGRMASPHLPSFLVDPVGSATHRAIAREAVRKSLVVLVNDTVAGKPSLPLPSAGTIAVHGSHADNSGLQCGGWTMGWQGLATNTIEGATTIAAGLRQVMAGATVTVSSSKVAGAKAAVFVVGEQPYAEMKGDLGSTAFSDFNPGASTLTLMQNYRTAGVPVVVVLVTGRPRPVPMLLQYADALVVAWLPGSEGAGVADVLAGAYAPTGTLPHSWPAAGADVPLNVGDGKTPKFPYGFGLTW